MRPEFRAAMFDMDGTLLCTMRYWRLTTLELLLACDIFPRADQLAQLFERSSRKFCAEILAEHGVEMREEEILAKLEGYMRRHYLSDARAKPRVGAYLDRLRAAEIPMCVGTAAPRDYAREGLARLGLDGYFRFITDCYEQEMSKAEPAFFHRMARMLGVRAGEMCVFEDALYAIQGAKAAGCPVIAIRDRTQLHNWEEIRALADLCVEGYDELIELWDRG